MLAYIHSYKEIFIFNTFLHFDFYKDEYTNLFTSIIYAGAEFSRSNVVRSDRSAEIGEFVGWLLDCGDVWGGYSDGIYGWIVEQYYYLVAYPAFKVFSYGSVH